MDSTPAPGRFGVIFDMDGLMLDTEAIARRCWERAFVSSGHAMTVALYASLIGRNKPDCVELLRAAFGPEFDFESTYAQSTVFFEEHVAQHGTPLKAGVLDVLRELSALGVPLAVATSTRNPKARLRLERAGLLAYFETVVAGDEVPCGKPAPDIYLEAIRRLGLDARQSFALEDSPPGVRAAHAAGLKVIMVPDLVPATEEIEALTHGVMPSLVEVRTVLSDFVRAGPDARGGKAVA